MTQRAQQSQSSWFAAGGILGAVLASSCCILPLVLVLLGVSGAWIGSLTALEPYKWYFLTATAALLGLGFWQVYFRSMPACEGDAVCARPHTAVVVQGILWLGAVLALLAATVDLWAPLFY